MDRLGPRLLLACAIAPEWDALSRLVADRTEVRHGSTVYELGTTRLADRVVQVCLCQVGVGNIESALETHRALEFFAPDVVLFVGVAGGIKDCRVGDVIAATKIYGYESGKETEQYLPRPLVGQSSYAFEQRARAVARSRSEGTSFRILVGPIAAGDKVVASATSTTATRLRALFSDALAVEMEGAGFFAAMRRYPGREFGVIRGVSDRLDGKELADAGGGQDLAASHAAEVALEIAGALLPEITVAEVDAAADGVVMEPVQLDVVLRAVERSQANYGAVFLLAGDSAMSEAVVGSGLPVQVVVDFDPRSDVDGLFARTHTRLSERQLVQLVLPGTESAHERGQAVRWILARAGDEQPPESSFRHWLSVERSTVERELRAVLSEIGARPVLLLVAFDQLLTAHIRSIAEACLSLFGSSVTIVSLTAPGSRIGLGAGLDPDVSVACTPAAVAEALGASVAPSPHNDHVLPHKDGSITVDQDDWAWLATDLEPIESGLGERGDLETERLEFLRGAQISWTALRGYVDVAREVTSALAERLATALTSRRAQRVNLFHQPGAGGSTAGRRVLWQYHDSTPSVVVQRYHPGETIRRIAFISRTCDLPLLLLVDSSAVSERGLDDMIDELRASRVSAVVLHVARRYSRASQDSASLFLPAILSDAEAREFHGRYSAERPERHRQLDDVLRAEGISRSPFFFGLAAFERTYHGLEPYVRGRLDGIDDSQSELLVLCAIAHLYGQRSIPVHAVAERIGIAPTRAGRLLRRVLPGVRDLLIQDAAGYVRTVHPIVAEEILVQLSSLPRDQWRQRLTGWGGLFIDFCRGTRGAIYDDALDLLYHVFVYRGSEDILGTEGAGRRRFSRYIEDVPSTAGAAQLLKALADAFPGEEHFAAHMARYYAFELRNYERAVEYASSALSIAPRSFILNHVLGMVHRSRVYDLIGSRAELGEMVPLAEKASEAFERSRELSENENEHGLISDAQMKVRLVDYATRASGSIAAYLRSSPDPYIVKEISGAEELLGRVREMRDRQGESLYERRASAELEALYGDYGDALQMFDALLTRWDSIRPALRRQIVHTYLRRRSSDWRQLTTRELQRSVDLLEENLTGGARSGSDLRLWFRAIRYLPMPPSQERVFEQLEYWRESSPSLDAWYYSYVAYAIDVLDGIRTATPLVNRYLTETISRSRHMPRRTWSYEWVGKGEGVSRLVHHTDLGDWDPSAEFWSGAVPLERVGGRVKAITGPQAGEVEIGGLRAFFVPSRAGVEKGRHEGRRVTGFLGFSYDGLRLWDVQVG